MDLEDVDPTSLGDIVEGELYKNSKGNWVVRSRDGEHSIDDLLEEYKNKDVRITFASLKDLANIAELVQQSEEEK